MGAFFSSVNPVASALGGSSSSSSGPANNNSLNVIGVGGGTFADLNRMLDLARGPQQNGGFTQNVPIRSALIGNPDTPNYRPLLIIGSLALVAFLVLKGGL